MSIAFVLGGVKSGKTRYAQKIASQLEQKGYPVVYVATSRILDNDFRKRVERHIKDRPKRWKTIEEDKSPSKAIKHDGVKSVYIIDCLTLLITNYLMDSEKYTVDSIYEDIVSELTQLFKKIRSSDSAVVIISNQVEAGLISEHKLGRDFQDISGLVHQFIADEANDVFLMTAGIPQRIKNDK